MTAWLVYRLKDVERNKAYIEFYKEEGKALAINIKLILVDKLKFGVKDNNLFIEYDGKPIKRPDFVINRFIYPLLTKHLEDMNIKVFNNSKVANICNDKAKTYQYISRLKIPMIDTNFIKSEYLSQAIEDIKETTIIKGVSGHGGNQVYLLNPEDEEAKKQKIVSKLKNSDLVLQPLVGSNNQDLRVYIIGKKIIAAILRTAKSGFKSNFSLGGKVKKYDLSEKEISLINCIINEFDFDLVGIDFLIDNDGNLLFNEIEDVVGARMLYQCTDINLVNLYLKHIISQII